MLLEIWIMGIAVSNVVSEYSLGGVYFTHGVQDMMFETGVIRRGKFHSKSTVLSLIEYGI